MSNKAWFLILGISNPGPSPMALLQNYRTIELWSRAPSQRKCPEAAEIVTIRGAACEDLSNIASIGTSMKNTENSYLNTMDSLQYLHVTYIILRIFPIISRRHKTVLNITWIIAQVDIMLMLFLHLVVRTLHYHHSSISIVYMVCVDCLYDRCTNCVSISQ